MRFGACFLTLLACGASAAAPAAADPLAELLESAELESATHPVAAEFFFGEGQAKVGEAERAEVKEQLVTSLTRQTSFIGMVMQGVSGTMGTDSMKQMQEWQKRNSAGSMMVKGALGLGPAPPPIDNNKMQAETQQAMVDPWVRGMGAAEALVAGGKLNAAATFYMNCLQLLKADWVPSACLDGIVHLGPKKAEKLLSWMLENAEGASMTNAANVAGEAAKRD